MSTDLLETCRGFK